MGSTVRECSLSSFLEVGPLMAAIGIGLIWLGYTVGLYGFCLFKGYDITPKQLLSQSWPPPKNEKAP